MTIDRLLRSRRATPLAVMMEALEVSRATVKRDLEYMRDRLGAPIVWGRALGGYRYEEGERFALPGLWFNASEIHALLTMEQLLEGLQPGWLASHIGPLKRRIRALLAQGEHSAEAVARRIRITRQAERPVDPEVFRLVSSAVLERRRLRLRHHHRGRDEVVSREVSPQRLVHYRNNWYLDAWCHLREGLRSFAVDAIEVAEPLDEAAREVPDEILDEMLRSGYGIFSGAQVRHALLRFAPDASRWVSRERWHARQEGWFDDEGRYCLRLPYSGDRELLMDLLRYGDAVEVLEPADLREKVAEAHCRACRRLGGAP